MMLSLASCGRHAEANELAQELRKSGAQDAYVLYKAAAGLALCASAVAQQQAAGNAPADAAELIERYAKSAVETLREAVASGLQLTAETAIDPNFEQLHPREDFQELLKQSKAPT